MAEPGSQGFMAAAVQASPVFLDLQATLDRTCELIAEAARNGASLIVFPEAFVPAYPDWAWVLPPGEGDELDALYAELVANSVSVPGPAVDRLCQAAKQAGAMLAIGVNERNTEASNGSLYNSLLFISAEGRLLGTHRKLVPTAAERTIWAQGDGSTLLVYDTPLGKLSGLICWENYMPLVRQSLYLQAAQVHVAATWDRGEPWLSTLRHIAREGSMYVLGCCMALRTSDIPDRFAFKQRYGEGADWLNGGDSAIVGPTGEVLAGPCHERQEILYAEIDPARTIAAKRMLDVAGHYARNDLFDFSTRRSPMGLSSADNSRVDNRAGARPPASNGTDRRRATRVRRKESV